MPAPPRRPDPGRYRHHKGGFYNVLGTALHTSGDEELVIYRPDGVPSHHRLWARPLAEFFEQVSSPENGYVGPRFLKVEERDA